MKIVIILVILCWSAHQNISNYISLLLALYMYLAEARVDAITLLNHLGLLVSYDVLQEKLKDVTSSTISWIKSQGSNSKLVGSWDNFEFCENIHGKRIGDTVKFWLITMAFWIQQGWRIPENGLKQWMWDSKRAHPDPFLVASKVFDHVGVKIRSKCQQIHWYNAFCTAFPQENSATSQQCPSFISLIVNARNPQDSFYLLFPCLMKAQWPTILLFLKISTLFKWS